MPEVSNIESVTALLTAINFDRFAEIQARHHPGVTFNSFRGATLHGNVDVADCHREFLRDYADCCYSDVEFIESGDTVCARATIEAKGYDWRRFEQRVLEVFRFEEGAVIERRLYGMLRDVQFDKAITAAMTNALGFKGGSVAETARAVEAIVAGMKANGAASESALFTENAVVIDGVYGIAAGKDGMEAIAAARPRPAFGLERVTASFAGGHNAVIETAIDPARPRKAEWLRFVDGKVAVDEVYWMLREIGVNPYENYARDRHLRQVILPT
ncbi:MAG TPA: nuclear transport factor 2 family protein [Tepidiformaceae bacterium]